MTKFIVNVQSRFNALRSEDGNAAEYGIIIAVVAIGVIAGLGVLVAALNGLFDDVGTALGQ